MDFTLEISRDNSANSYYPVDLFPDQRLEYDLDFYDSFDIDKVKIPFYTNLRIPLTDVNKDQSRFDFAPFTSLSADFPNDDFFFRINIYGQSRTSIEGMLNVVSFEYNSSEPYIEVELKDYISMFLSKVKEFTLGSIYGIDSFYSTRMLFSDFLKTTANDGFAGTINQNPDYSKPISFPYIDFCNDVQGKFGYAARQFLEYGPSLNRTGIMPVFSVPKFLEYIGKNLNAQFTDFDVRVDSKLFGMGTYGGNPILPQFQPEKLHMVVPSQLLAKQDINTRNFFIRQSPAWAGTNQSLTSSENLLGDPNLITTNWFGAMETAGNYGTDGEGNPLYGTQEWGAEKRMGFYPYDFTNGFDEDGIRGFFCPKVSFNAALSLHSGSPSATIEGLKYEIPIIQEDKMVKDIRLQSPNSTMTFRLNIGIYEDGLIKKQIPMLNAQGDELIIDLSTATVSQGYSNKNDYTATFDYFSTQTGIVLQNYAGTILSQAITWNDVINFEPIEAFFPQDEEMFINGGSEYSINYFLEPLEGQLDIEYADNYAYQPSNPPFPAHWVYASTAQAAFEVYDIKKAITRIGEPNGSGVYGQLNIRFTSNQDTFLYKTDDEFIISESIDKTCPLSVQEILLAILKRFDCGMFYEFDSSASQHVLRIDPLFAVREGNQNIDDLVDDLKSVIISNGGDKVKTLNINNKDYNLYFDDFNNDDVTIGSTTQNINPNGIAEIKLDLESSVYYNSVCGPEGPSYDEITNYNAFSQSEIGFTENIFTQNKDVGLRFAFLDKPLYSTNLMVPYATLKGFQSTDAMRTESQIIYSNFYAPSLTTNIGGKHVFNGRLFSHNTAGWSLLFEDEDGNTTDSYDEIFAVSEKILQSENPKITFDMVVPTSELASLNFFLQTLSCNRITSNRILVKSASGDVFDNYAYLTIEGILQ